MPKKATKSTVAEKTAVKAESQAEVKETKAAKSDTKPAAKTETKTTKTTKASKETITTTIEFGGKNTKVESIIDSIKEAYKAEGNKAAIKTLDVYIQPENNVAFYVINGKVEGKSVNF